ncbi:MAG: hypothetical protein WD341_12110 [Tistlia sp.]|uniref:hypothetical protein n=1 Tax=Tistlia sp. TaxID=3057121 RepID=UPI0034A5BB1F
MAAGPLPGGPGPERAGDRPDPGLVALLSLQLLLLAFFILLTALSQYEQDRVQRVVESVTDAFGVPFESAEPQPLSAGSLGFHEAMKPVAEELRRVAAAALPVRIEIKLHQDGELRIEIPYQALFGLADASPRATVRPLFVTLSRALLGHRFADRAWTLDASSRLAGFPGRGSALERDLAVGRAAAVVRSLAALGLPAERLAAGLLDGPDQSLRLRVRPPAIAAVP